jgi:hypothetical protein
MTLLENYAQNIETEKNQIREDHLKMQTHTMKYNLIFGGIEQTALDFSKIWSYTNDARIPRLWSSFIFG